MLGVYALTNLFQATANWVMARVSQQALRDLRRDLFRPPANALHRLL
jgi:hypothetical protein